MRCFGIIIIKLFVKICLFLVLVKKAIIDRRMTSITILKLETLRTLSNHLKPDAPITHAKITLRVSHFLLTSTNAFVSGLLLEKTAKLQ